MERAGDGPKAGAEVNPFWSKRVQEEVRLREARPEGLPPVPESGDEEEPVRTPLKAAEGEAAAKRNRARAFMSPEERLADEKRELALQAVKRDLRRIGGEGPPEEGGRNKGPSGGGGEDWDGAGSAGDKGRPATPEDRLEGELSRVMIEEYGAVNMNLAEALRQRNELRHKVERLELEKIVVEAEAEQNRRMAELWESRARQAEKYVELLTDQITVLEQRPQQFHTPQQEEEPHPPRPETPPPPPPGIRSKRQKLEMTPGGTRVPQDPPPYDHEWPNPENGWVMDGVSYKPAWGRSRSTSREEKPAASRPRWTRSRSTSKDGGEARKSEEGKPAVPVAPLLQQKPKSRPEVKEMRATDLPELVGDGSPLTFGDWMATIDHYMKDISTYSAMWWEEVCASAKEAYAEWLVASPLQRLRIKPELPLVCMDLPRTEQRGVAMVLKALPESVKKELVANRQLSMVNIIYRLYILYQPGGASERQQILNALLDTKGGNASEVAKQLRSWRHWRKRALELGVALPDATLLVSALDKFAAALSKLDQQSSYRMSTVRAELNLDTRPTQEAVESFAEYLQAESETAELAKGGKETAPKVKAMGGAGKEEAGPWKPSSGGGTPGKPRVVDLSRACKWYATDAGCRFGKNCKFAHVWDSLDRQKERCWNCGSLEHRKAECPRPGPQGGSGGGQAAAGGGEGAKRRAGTPPGNKGAVRKAAGGKSQAAEPVVEEEMEEVVVEETGGKDKLMAEATQLLKSVRMKKLKAARLSKIGECQSWGLLDGGATHALRQARKGETGEDRMVELADGREVVMQMTEGHTLICKEATQVIVPLGALYLLGYKIRWEEGICCIEHASRGPLPVRMRQFCPEVPTEVALRLVEELEEFNKGLLRRAATAATKSMRKPDVKKGLCSRVAEAWTKGEMEKVKGEFEQLFPEVPAALLERALGHRRRKGNRLESGGEEEACQGDRVDPAPLRREECEEVQLRAVGQGDHCGGYPVGPGFA